MLKKIMPKLPKLESMEVLIMQEKTKTLLKTRMVQARKLNNLRYRKV